MKRLFLLACTLFSGFLAFSQELSLAVLNKPPYFFEKVGLENSDGDFVYLYRNGQMKTGMNTERNLVCFYLPDEGKLIPFAKDSQDMSVKTHVFWQKGNQYIFLFESFSAKMALEVYDVKTERRISVAKGIIPVVQGSKELNLDKVLYLKQKKFLYVTTVTNGSTTSYVLRSFNYGINEHKTLAEIPPTLDAATGRMFVNDFDYNPSNDAFSWKAQ